MGGGGASKIDRHHWKFGCRDPTWEISRGADRGSRCEYRNEHILDVDVRQPELETQLLELCEVDELVVVRLVSDECPMRFRWMFEELQYGSFSFFVGFNLRRFPRTFFEI